MENKVRFRAYILLKPGICMRLLQYKLNHEEIESVLYGLYIYEKQKYKLEINNMVELGKDIVKKIIKKNKGNKEGLK